MIISETIITNTQSKTPDLESPAINKSNLNPSKVLDEIIDNQTKSGTSQINESSLNESKKSGTGNQRRRRLFNPTTHNYDQSFDVPVVNAEKPHDKESNVQSKVNQTRLSETNNSVLSSNELPKRTVSINSGSNQTIPMGQKPPNDTTSDKSRISSNDSFNVRV